MMRRLLTVGLAFAIGTLMFSSQALAELKLPAMFTDGAVLQQNMEVPVWGWADPGAEVQVSFAGQTKTAKANDDGKWSVKLDKLKANKTGAELKVKSGDDSLSVKDVLVGEVWFCSGQSNMEWMVRNSVMPDFVKPDELPMIRHIKVPHVRAQEPADDFKGAWTVCNKNTVGNFTAVGFFFAYELQKKLDVPIGLIGCNWGGTRIEPWTPPAGFEKVKELDAKFAQRHLHHVQRHGRGGRALRHSRGDLVSRRIQRQRRRKLLSEDAGFDRRLAGDLARRRFSVLLRAAWPTSKQPNPDPAGGDGYAKLRDAQLKAMKNIPHTGMA